MLLLNNSTVSAAVAVFVAYTISTIYKKWYWVFNVPGTSLFQWDISGDMRKLVEWKQHFGQRMVDSYGRLYRIVMNGNPVLVIADPTHCKELYQGSGVHSHPKGLGLGKFFERHLGDCMGCLNGKEWTRLRKTFKPAMSLKAAENGAMVMQKVLDEWDEKTVKPLAMQDGPVAVTDLVDQLPMKTITVVFFGYDFVTRHEEEIDRLRYLSAKIMNTIFSNKWAAGLPFYERLNTKANDELCTFKREWVAFLEAYMVSKEREEGCGGVFDHVAAMALNEDKNALTSETLLQTIVEIVFANQDIAVPSYSWMFAHLAAYPEIAADIALQQCNKDVNINERLEDLDEQSFIADKTTLENTYPEILNFITESARVNPVLVLSSQAILEKPTKIGETIFAPGTRVSLDNYSMNHHPQYWEKPETFDPWRFLQLNEYTKRWCFSRFGNGVRSCPGQYYANLGMGNALLRLITKYEIVPAGNSNTNDVITHHKDIPVDPNQAIVTPNLKLHIRLRPVYQNGSTPDLLLKHPVYAMVSILKTHPLIRPTGARQLIKFLSTLSQPSTILLVDSLNRHNINAFEVKTKSDTPQQDKKCREKAMERAEEYWRAVKSEIDALDDEDVKKKIKLIRWDDIQDNRYEAQIKIVEKHYQRNPVLKEKIDAIAEGFVRLRLPQARKDSVEKRLPFMVKYITQEMPILVTGHLWEGKHHSLLVYPTEGEGQANINDRTISTKDDGKPSMRNLIYDVKNSELFEDLRNELIEACGGYRAAVGNITLPLIAPHDTSNKKTSSNNQERKEPEKSSTKQLETIEEEASIESTKFTKIRPAFDRQVSVAG